MTHKLSFIAGFITSALIMVVAFGWPEYGGFLFLAYFLGALTVFVICWIDDTIAEDFHE